MDRTDNKLDNLLALTEGKSDTDKTLLFRHVAHLLVQQKDSENLKEQFLMMELFDALAKRVSEATRAELARDLSKMEEPPTHLAARLARDKIYVAGPILKRVSFGEKALLDIIRDTTRAHHLVITERADLSQKVWQAIRKAKELEEGLAPRKKLEFSLKSIPRPDDKVGGTDLFLPDHDQPSPVFSETETPLKTGLKRAPLLPDLLDTEWKFETDEMVKSSLSQRIQDLHLGSPRILPLGNISRF